MCFTLAQKKNRGALQEAVPNQFRGHYAITAYRLWAMFKKSYQAYNFSPLILAVAAGLSIIAAALLASKTSSILLD